MSFRPLLTAITPVAGTHRLLAAYCLLPAACCLLAGCNGTPPPPGETSSIGPMKIQVRAEPPEARAGLPVRFIVAITDANGPVRDAAVRVQLFCRTLNQQGPDSLAIEDAASPGRYQTEPLTPGVAGLWEAQVHVSEPYRGSGTVRFPFKVLP
jgi:hypothetical protein